MTQPFPGVKLAAAGQSGGTLGMAQPDSPQLWQPMHILITAAQCCAFNAVATALAGGGLWSIFSAAS